MRHAMASTATRGIPPHRHEHRAPPPSAAATTAEVHRAGAHGEPADRNLWRGSAPDCPATRQSSPPGESGIPTGPQEPWPPRQATHDRDRQGSSSKRPGLVEEFLPATVAPCPHREAPACDSGKPSLPYRAPGRGFRCPKRTFRARDSQEFLENPDPIVIVSLPAQPGEAWGEDGGTRAGPGSGRRAAGDHGQRAGQRRRRCMDLPRQATWQALKSRLGQPAPAGTAHR